MDIFTNKSVVVTGAAGALGLTVANAFVHAGANVTGIDVIDFKADFRTLKANLIELESTKTALAEVRSVDILSTLPVVSRWAIQLRVLQMKHGILCLT